MSFLLCCFLILSSFANEVRHEIVPNKFFPDHKVEFFWKAPPGPGPYPVFILLHGHQGTMRKGAVVFTEGRTLDMVAMAGQVAVAVSHSGYGETTGSPDNAGPVSQAALRTVIARIKKHPKADPKKIILYGFSMGATLAAITATQEPELAGVILENGMYDIETSLTFLRFRAIHDEGVDFLLRLIESETLNRYQERSALIFADRIKSPVLLMAGLGDNFVLPDQSFRLHEKIIQSGGHSELILYPFAGHSIPLNQKAQDLNDFLQRIWKQ